MGFHWRFSHGWAIRQVESCCHKDSACRRPNLEVSQDQVFIAQWFRHDPCSKLIVELGHPPTRAIQIMKTLHIAVGRLSASHHVDNGSHILQSEVGISRQTLMLVAHDSIFTMSWRHIFPPTPYSDHWQVPLPGWSKKARIHCANIIAVLVRTFWGKMSGKTKIKLFFWAHWLPKKLSISSYQICWAESSFCFLPLFLRPEARPSYQLTWAAPS